MIGALRLLFRFSTIPAALTLLAIASAAVCAPAPLPVEVWIAEDRGRHYVLLPGLPPETPGLEAAAAKLLGCQVEAARRGFRCRLRRDPEGLTLDGVLDLSAIAALPAAEGRRIDLLVRIPPSPATWVAPPLARFAEDQWHSYRAGFRGEVDPTVQPRLAYRAGFPSAWVWIAALLPIPLLLWWVGTRPGQLRWLWVAGVTAWVASMGWSGAIWYDSYFTNVPSIDGALLRWLAYAPLFVIVIGQACWLDPRFREWRIWAFFGAIEVMRPRTANWMSVGEGLMGSLISFGLLALWAWILFGRGSELALLPEGLLARVQGRLRSLARPQGGFDLRLDRLPRRGEAGGASRFGSLVTVPSAWIERLSGKELEAAVLLAAARWRYAPGFSVLIVPALVWEIVALLATGWPLLPALVPPAAAAWFWFRERAWHRRIASELVAAGEHPELLRSTLAAIEPEWGSSAASVRREVERLAGAATPVVLR